MKQAYAKARLDAENASARAEALAADVCVHAADIARTLQREWDQHRDAARQAAQIVRDGPGRLGQRRAAIRRATEDLAHWSATWQPYLPTMPTRTDDVVRFAERVDDTRRIHAAFERYGRAIAAHARPEYRAAHADADNAVRNRDDAWRAYRDASGQYSVDLSRYGSLAHHDDPAGHLADVEQTITATRAHADEAGDRISSLLAEPTLRTLPADRIESERDTWRVERDARECGRYAGSTQLEADLRVQHSAHEHDIWVSPSAPDQSPSIGR